MFDWFVPTYGTAVLKGLKKGKPVAPNVMCWKCVVSIKTLFLPVDIYPPTVVRSVRADVSGQPNFFVRVVRKAIETGVGTAELGLRKTDFGIGTNSQLL